MNSTVPAAPASTLSPAAPVGLHVSQERSTDSRRKLIVVFARYPRPGRVKTRLIPALGRWGAAALHRQLVEHTLHNVRALAETPDLSAQIRFHGSREARVRVWLGPDLDCRAQTGKDLGERMDQAFAEAFREGMSEVVVIGTDCPALSKTTIEEAFRLLQHHSLVLGPALDGGYYLIGLRSRERRLFEGIPWGSDQVFARTRDRAKELGLSIGLLTPLCDVDRPEDLIEWDRVRSNQTGNPTMSIIIPCFQESANLPETLKGLNSIEGTEVLVVDGGSRDHTMKYAGNFNVRLLKAPRNRAQQMNLGAREAKGDLLLFLHADTRLPSGFEKHVRRLLTLPGVAAGAFRMKLDSPRASLRIVEHLVNWRSDSLQLPYGDQAVFVRSGLFREIGGFRDLPIMEDYDIVRRLARRGRIVLSSESVLVSARRWETVGVLQTTLINQAIIAAFNLRVKPERLARWYHRHECSKRQRGQTYEHPGGNGS